MLIEKSNLLQRVRVVMIALVAVIGFGTMAMKPVDPTQSTYGVAQTAGAQNWRVVANIASLTPDDYECNKASTEPVCKVHYDSGLSTNDLIPIDNSLIVEKGNFILF